MATVGTAGAAEERHDVPPADVADPLCATPAKVSSRTSGISTTMEGATPANPRANPMARALEEISRKQKDLFGDTGSPLSTPKSPVASPLRAKPLCSPQPRSPLAPCQKGLQQELRDRSADAAVREQRRKSKENMKVSAAADEMGFRLNPLLLRDSPLRNRKKEQPGIETPEHERFRRAFPLSSPQRPLLRQALDQSSKKTAMELARSGQHQLGSCSSAFSPGSPRMSPARGVRVQSSKMAAMKLPQISLPHYGQLSPLCSRLASGRSTASDGDASIHTEPHVQTKPCDLSDGPNLSSFHNVTIRRLPGTPCTLLSPEVDDSPGAAEESHSDWNASLCFLKARPKETSGSEISSSATSATNYMGLPEGFGLAHVEAYVQRYRQEDAAQREQARPTFYNTGVGGMDVEDTAMGRNSLLEAHDRLVHSPGTLDTAFIETSPSSGVSPVSQISSHDLSPVSQTSSAQHYEPDGSSPVHVITTRGSTTKGDEETDSLQYIETSPGGESSPAEVFYWQSPRPPLMARMLANQEVLIPHQLSTIAEIDTSASSKGSSGSRGRLSEEALLMNVAQPTLVPADATCGIFEHYSVSHRTTSPMSDSLISFMQHEESLALCEETP